MCQEKKESVRMNKRAVLIGIADIFLIILAWYGALWTRFDFKFTAIPSEYLSVLNRYILWIVVATLIVYGLFRLYRSIWSFFSIHELFRVFYAYLFLILIYGFFIFTGFHLPRSVYAMAILLSFIFAAALRISYRLMRLFRNRYSIDVRRNRVNNTMIIGAGRAGSMVLRELLNNRETETRVRCLIDDNPMKLGKDLNGVLVAGNRYDIPRLVEKYEINEIIYAIPTAKGSDKKAILDICKQQKGCALKVVPGIYQLVNGEIAIDMIRPVEIEDLLGRDPIRVNNEEIFKYLRGKTVMVTGGGGSIGSELCRQIGRCEPERLIIFDIYENCIYDLQQEMKRTHPNLVSEFLVGSVRNKERIDDVLEHYQPDIIFHAAAHKHVPLMEDSPCEAIKNNVFGTYNVAESAGEHGVKKFVLISTDKAVNPTNIMGASKRLCEEVVQMMNRRFDDTEFVAVRFGNVLGSNGSVIPLFKKQIQNGGPVTVTHPDIIRYFMTIPEAVSLVLQAGFYAKGGEIFVLDMGEPVKIDDMARNLIRLSGYEPGVDIEIKYTGLRPGEKLYEELLMDEEGMEDTVNKLIHIGKPLDIDDEALMGNLIELRQACYGEAKDIKKQVAKMVSTYRYQEV